jgi:NADPH:quinone reductase-like Zn-dependent oxidoreductase
VCRAAVAQKPVPQPAQGEVLVRVTLRPINPVEAMCLAGATRKSLSRLHCLHVGRCLLQV